MVPTYKRKITTATIPRIFKRTRRCHENGDDGARGCVVVWCTEILTLFAQLGFATRGGGAWKQTGELRLDRTIHERNS